MNNKKQGMIHIKGVNDKAYAEYLANLKPNKEQVMITIVDNRW
jgi:predicted RNA-binding protein with RPS1 domain